jgi:hypothetical protein
VRSHLEKGATFLVSGSSLRVIQLRGEDLAKGRFPKLRENLIPLWTVIIKAQQALALVYPKTWLLFQEGIWNYKSSLTALQKRGSFFKKRSHSSISLRISANLEVGVSHRTNKHPVNFLDSETVISGFEFRLGTI